MPATRTEVQRRAGVRPVDGSCRALALEVRRLMGVTGEPGREFLTSRMAAALTGLNHSTVTEAARGTRPTESTCFRLAYGLGGDPALLLRLAGYEAFTPRMATPAPAGAAAGAEAELLALYRALPDAQQALLLTVARAVRESAEKEAE